MSLKYNPTRLGYELECLGVNVYYENYEATISIPKDNREELIKSLEKSGFEVLHEKDNIFSIRKNNEN